MCKGFDGLRECLSGHIICNWVLGSSLFLIERISIRWFPTIVSERQYVTIGVSKELSHGEVVEWLTSGVFLVVESLGIEVRRVFAGSSLVGSSFSGSLVGSSLSGPFLPIASPIFSMFISGCSSSLSISIPGAISPLGVINQFGSSPVGSP